MRRIILMFIVLLPLLMGTQTCAKHARSEAYTLRANWNGCANGGQVRVTVGNRMRDQQVLFSRLEKNGYQMTIESHHETLMIRFIPAGRGPCNASVSILGPHRASDRDRQARVLTAQVYSD